MSSRKRKSKRKRKPKPKRRRSDFVDVASTSGSSGASSSQKRKRLDFADGALTLGSSGMSSCQKQKRSDFTDDASTSGYKYDVFLSFRGPDTRYTVADVLYETLDATGFNVFRDNEELQVGENIGRELERAIDDSRIYVPIFSEGYASSPWCLQELARMVKCRRESAGHEIVPVFSGASPSDVRLKRGPYGDDLLRHKGCYGGERVREWREALWEVADLKGWDVRNLGLGKLVNNLVRELSIKLKKRQMVLPDHLVGIDDRVRDVMPLLDYGSLDVRFLLVHGMGGIGKTTLVKAVFNEISSLFDGYSFLSDIRENSSKDGGIVSLQRQLLSDILNWSKDVNDVNDGINLIREKFRNKRVLIVLDDIDNQVQLKKLPGNTDWLGPGSRVIVTTRNVRLMNFLPEGSRAYEMTEMSTRHALQLFSKHAFRETPPPDDRKTLSNDIVATTGKIPLALEASGSFLRGRSPDEWAETLERLRKAPHEQVRETLRISYKALTYEEKQIFLDIACFFNGEESTSAKYAWKGYGYSPGSGLATLTSMSLLKIDHQNILRMHDLIRDFGRGIVREENRLNPGSQSRLWVNEECLHVLREQRKSKVESLRLQFSGGQIVTSQEFKRLPNLRFLRLEGGNLVGDYMGLLRNLRWLSWHDIPPAHFRATNFSPRKLAVLKLSGSELGDDWPGWHQFMKLSELRLLELEECSRLIRLPDLSALRALQRLTLRGCQNLVEIDRSIGKLDHLNYLEIYDCTVLRELPKEVNRLKEVIVRGTIHGPVGSYLPHSISSNLRSLTWLNVRISELPDSIGELKHLKRMSELKHLIEWLSLFGCYELQKLSDSIGELKHLKGLSVLKHLKGLSLSGCYELQKLPNSNLKRLNLSGCKQLKKLPDSIGDLKHLKRLSLSGCYQLTEASRLNWRAKAS